MIQANLYKLAELMADILDANIAVLFVGIFTSRNDYLKHRRDMMVCAMICGIAAYILDEAALVSVVKSLVVLCGFFVCVKTVFKVRWQKVLLWESLYVVLSVTIELLCMFCMQFSGIADVASFTKWGVSRMVVIITEKIICTLIILLLYGIFGKKESVYFRKKYETIVLFMCIVLIAMLLFFWINHATGKYTEIVNLSFLILSAGTVLFLMYTLFITTEKIERQQQLELIQLQNRVLKQSLSETQNAYAHWQKQIHDYKNTVICLSSMLTESDNSAVKAFLEQEMEQMNKESHLINTGNSMMDAILNLKYIEAERRHIFFSIQGCIKENFQIPEIDVGRILGNLLDNAIEGACHSDTKAYVEVVLESSRERLIIEVNNSSTSEKIDFRESSKENTKLHGIGLQSIREIVRKYEGIFEIEQLGNRVTARVEFY